MSFKPAEKANRSSTERDFTGVLPVPKAGSRKARVSLIVDLGKQERDPIYKIGDKVVTEETEGAVATTQKPCQQVAVFVDLVNDVVDYGGEIGKKQYRLMLNKSFLGEVNGINFTASPPMDAKGNRVEGKPWGFHPQNVLTKLAKAVQKEEIITSMDVDELLDQPFMADVEVSKKEDKNGKEDKDGNVIIYTNVNFKGAAKLPEDDDTNEPVKVAALTTPAMSIQFDTATKEQVAVIRPSLRKKIKLALNYAGSQMEKAIQAFEAERAEKEDAAPAKEAVASKAVAKAVKPAKTKPAPQDIGGDDVPF